MKFFPERTAYSVLFVFVLGSVLTVLAVLQYLWSGQISEAENEHMRVSLRTSMDQFRRQFNNELVELGSHVRFDNAAFNSGSWNDYAKSCSAVFQSSYSLWVRHIYLWVRKDSGDLQLLRLNRESVTFEAVDWPSSLDAIRRQQERFFPGSFRPELSIRPFSWTLFLQIPLMVQPLRPVQPESPGSGVLFPGYVLIELNKETISQQVFPELAQKIFQGPQGYLYHVAIMDRSGSGNLLFRSDSGLTIQSFARFDEKMALFEKRREQLDPLAPEMEPRSAPSGDPIRRPFREIGWRSGVRRNPRLPGPDNPGMSLMPMRPPMGFQSGPRFMGVIAADNDTAEWELIAKHREGSLENAVARVRRRNLAISFGSLLLLAASMSLIFVSARRAQTLARLQLDFVAGVSHELRTPLAVICSAGDNLAEGVLETSHRSVKEYGQLILDEGRKLSGMVEQILQYAATQRRNNRLNMRKEDLNAFVDTVLKQMQSALVNFDIEKILAPDLPPVRVDPAVFVRCIHNLIQNALKYSGDRRWIGIRTMAVSVKGNTEVRLLIEDRGMGIAGNDLPHVFEPFYRGSAAIEAQIHGAGLGLFLARDAVRVMQGDLTVKSAPGKGSTFTVHLPAAPGSDNADNAGKG